MTYSDLAAPPAPGPDDAAVFDPGFTLMISKKYGGITIHDDEVLGRLKSVSRANNMTLDDYLNKLLLGITADICGKERMNGRDKTQ